MAPSAVPSLERICLEALACSTQPYWQLQKRRMQLLPEHIANALVQLLLQYQRLQSASQMDAFRDCVTALHISSSVVGGALTLDAEWLAHILSLRQLHTLCIRDVPRLKDKALLGPLLAASSRQRSQQLQLQHLDLTGCSGLTSRCLQTVAQLTGLRSLVLTGTSVKSPVLGQLTALQHLTRLHLGGCDVSDSDITQHLTAFSNLQDLDLWGCAAGDASARCIARVLHTVLSRLSLAWTQVTSSALPLLPGLAWLDLSKCRLCGPCSDASFAAATCMQQLRVLLLAEADVDAWGCELLEAVLRSSAPTLCALDLTNASLSSQLPLLLALESATQLSALSLAGTQLADDYLPALSACTALHTLNLSANPEVTAAGFCAALPGFAAQLQQLDLSGTAVDDTVLAALKHAPRLQQLVLSATSVRSWQSTSAGVGWASLQVVDVSGTQLSEAGCLELVADMLAAAGGQGLRVLHIGSRSSKLGRKALAGLGQLTSLEQLTLKGGWELADRDLERHLQPLQQLQQLHVRGVDPWLLADDALLQLATQLPQLSCVTRDGRQLLNTRSSMGAAWSAGSHSSTRHAGASDLATATGVGSIWPAGRHQRDDDTAQLAAVTVPGSGSKQRGSCSAVGDRSPAGSAHGSGGGTVYQRLSAFDERLRYSTAELLAVRENVRARPGACAAADLSQLLPDEVQAGSRW